MNSEELKDRVKDDLGQMLEAHGIKADISEHHVEKLNASYEALSITPEGSHIGVNANLSAICDAIEDGQSYSEVVARTADSIIAGIENTPEINVEDLTNYDEMKSKLAMEVVSADRNAEMLENVPHEQMEDMGGVFRKTCGVIPGKCFRTPRLTRFGYITLTAGKPVFGRSAEEIGEIPAHEFHYFDSENCGSDFHAAKPMSKRGWDCMHSSSNLLAGYPHIYYYGNPQIPRAFLMKCLEYHNSKE